MNKIKGFFRCFSLKQIVLTAAVVLCLLFWCGLTVFSNGRKNVLADQTAAERWSGEGNAAQITCFFTESAEIDKNKIRGFEAQLDKMLLEASITASNENARLWADAYSAVGRITLSNGKSTLEANAIGIGGDFFLFHPLQLLNGSYFSGNDLMYDKVIVDEDAAWQLFGSNDVVGMQVTIGGIPHYIAGVIRREDGRFHEAAGLDKTLVYVSCETLSELGTTDGINSYEVVMPNPVEDFAYINIKEKFGISENDMWVVENSSRFGIEKLLTVISEFGMRSMNDYAIHFPYWENVARGWEDVFALVLMLQILFLLVPAVIVTVTLIILWKRKRWNWRTVWQFLTGCRDKAAERFRREKNKWKYF